MLTMNIPAVPQTKPSADNPMTGSLSGARDAQEPATKEFAKVLQREVSEKPNKQEMNSTPAKSQELQENPSSPDSGDSVPTQAAAEPTTPSTAPTTAPAIDNVVNNVIRDAAHPYALDQSLLPLNEPIHAEALTFLTSATPSPLPQNALIPQDNKLAANPFSLAASQLLQQKPVQDPLGIHNAAYSPSDFWQSMDMAESAANGKLLPFSSDMSEAIQMTTGEAIFSISSEPLSTQTFGLSTTSSTTPLQTSPQNIQVEQPVGQPKWGGEFAQKIVWLTSQQHQVAEIHLNPAHLGPVDVMLSISQDQATAQFSSPHLAVREAIQEALPRLREMMAENGIQLGNVMVGADSFQQENKQQQSYSQTRSNANETSVRTDSMGQMETTVAINRHQGMVNTYA